MVRHAALLMVVLCATAVAAPGKLTYQDKAMGTSVSVWFWTDKEADAAKAAEAMFGEMKRLDKEMTTWLPDSDLSRINTAAGDKPVKVSDETITVIQRAIDVSKRSNGVFDITVQAFHGLWKFDEDMDKTLPAPAEIEKRRKLINWRDVLVDHKAGTVKLRRTGMRMGLGGIAKGYAVDRCAAVLRAEGLHDFMVQAGGDLYVAGRKGSSPWMVGVRDPRGGPRDIIARMPIEDHAFSTAGDYERGFVLRGKRYHHIIDPKTGYPATASRGVTIFAPSAFLADGLDDAVFILGPKKGMRLVDSFPDCATVIVDAHNQVWMSKSLEGKLQRLAAPTDGI